MRHFMKSCFIILLVFVGLQSFASGITVGLHSENLIAWSVWESNEGKLKHQLLIFNKGKEKINVEIKLKQFKAGETGFEEINGDKTIHKANVGSNQLVKTDYPEKSTELDFMEFFENDKSVGMLRISTIAPAPSFITKKFKFYSSEALNTGDLGYWIRLVSIYDPNTEVGISTEMSEGGYDLIKIITNEKEMETYWSKLFALHPSDTTILKLSGAGNSAAAHFKGTWGEKKVLTFPILKEHVSGDKVTGISGGKAIPVFRKSEEKKDTTK